MREEAASPHFGGGGDPVNWTRSTVGPAVAEGGIVTVITTPESTLAYPRTVHAAGGTPHGVPPKETCASPSADNAGKFATESRAVAGFRVGVPAVRGARDGTEVTEGSMKQSKENARGG